MSDSLNDYYAERIAQEAARRLEEMANVTDSRTNGITLLPCPFCGSEAEIHPSNDWDVRFTGATYFAWCDKCETRGDYYSTEAEAVEAWNTRSVTAAAVMGYEAAQAERTCKILVKDNLAETEGMGDVWLECDACNWQMPLEPSTPRFNYCPNCGAKVVER